MAPPGKLDLQNSIFAQPPPEPEIERPGRRLTISEELDALRKATEVQEASYAAKKAELDETMGKAPPPIRPPMPPPNAERTQPTRPTPARMPRGGFWPLPVFRFIAARACSCATVEALARCDPMPTHAASAQSGRSWLCLCLVFSYASLRIYHATFFIRRSSTSIAQLSFQLPAS